MLTNLTKFQAGLFQGSVRNSLNPRRHTHTLKLVQDFEQFIMAGRSYITTLQRETEKNEM